MSGLIRARLRMAFATVSLLLILAGIIFGIVGSWRVAACCLLWGYVLQPLDREPRLAKNQAIVTAPVEPSADIREWASLVTQARAALINEGHSPEETSRLLADWMAAVGRETDS